MKCSCEGGKVFAFINRGEDYRTHTQGMVTCPTCDGTGSIDDALAARMVAGKSMRDARVARRESLSEAAARLGVSPALLSKIERGHGPAEAYN